MTKQKVMIIGGGIIGATTACRLAAASADVTLIDPMDENARASAGSLAWLNVSSTADPDYARLRLASLRLWHQLLKAHPECPVRFSGALLFGEDRDAISAHSKFMSGLGWPALVLDANELSKMLPGLVNAPDAALFATHEGAAHPNRITAWMLDRARSSGVNVFQGHVRALRIKGGAVCGAELRGGDRISTDTAVISAGNESRTLLAEAGVDLPLDRSPGILMRTAPVKYRIPYVIATPRLDFWQDISGAILMSSSLSKTPERADGLIAEQAVSVLTDMFPGIPELKVTRIARRDRPIPADGFPLVGKAGPKGLWVAATHSGMTLAPVIAEALADQILGCPDRLGMAAYRPDRNINAKQERAAL